MSATACSLLRHDVRPRWIGDLLAAFCHTCGCLFIPEPTPAQDPFSPGGRVLRSGGLAVPATVSPPPLAARSSA